jgi:hypothetical protein
MSGICPECGAVLNGDDTCQTIFDSFLVLEFTDPAYGMVHMLTVACFMIQHGRCSDEALRWIEQKLRANLEEGISTERIRQQAYLEADQEVRNWKVNRQLSEPLLPKVAWSVTIADVASNAQDAESYCDWVKRWGRATLQEMKPLLAR